MSSFKPKLKKLGTDNYEQLQLSYALSQQGRFDEALLELLAVLQREDSLPHTMLVYLHLALGNIYWLQKRYNEALSHFYVLSKLDPLIALGHVKIGNSFLSMGQFDKALEEFQLAWNLDPKSVSVHLGLGQISMKSFEYDRAISYFHRALELDSDAVFAYVLLAEIYRKQGDSQGAVNALKAALKIKPRMLLGYVRLGHVYLAEKEYQLAEQSFRTALDLNSLSIDAKLGLADSLIAVSQLKTAIDLLEEIPEMGKLAAEKTQISGVELALSGQVNRLDESGHLDVWLYACALEEQEQFLIA